MIEKSIEFLKEHLYSTKSFDDGYKKYRYEHSLRVGNIAREIAIKENANVLICTLAGILHDVGKFDASCNEEHARVSGQIARPFVESLGLTEKEENDICFAIAVHFDGNAGYDYENFIEAEIVSDADNIDRFDVLRAYQEIQSLKVDSTDIEVLIEKLTKRIDRLNKMIDTVEFSTPTSTRLFKDNLKFQVKIFENLLKQYKISTKESLLK